VDSLGEATPRSTTSLLLSAASSTRRGERRGAAGPEDGRSGSPRRRRYALRRRGRPQRRSAASLPERQLAVAIFRRHPRRRRSTCAWDAHDRAPATPARSHKRVQIRPGENAPLGDLGFARTDHNSPKRPGRSFGSGSDQNSFRPGRWGDDGEGLGSGMSAAIASSGIQVGRGRDGVKAVPARSTVGVAGAWMADRRTSSQGRSPGPQRWDGRTSRSSASRGGKAIPGIRAPVEVLQAR